jgi:hypothetical protein
VLLLSFLFSFDWFLKHRERQVCLQTIGSVGGYRLASAVVVATLS